MKTLPIMMEDVQPTVLQTQIAPISRSVILLLHGQLIQSPVYCDPALAAYCPFI